MGIGVTKAPGFIVVLLYAPVYAVKIALTFVNKLKRSLLKRIFNEGI